MATHLDEIVVLAQIPRDGRDKVTCTLSLDIGIKAAGCVICDRPIPPGISRLKIVVMHKGPTGPRAWPSTMTHYMHTGCITDQIRPEIARKGTDCYDCGQPADFGYRAFTVTEFAYAPLCEACVDSRRWAYCSSCCTNFPHHMVEELDETLWRALAGGGAEPLLDVPYYVCRACVERYDVPTKRDHAAVEAEHQQIDAEYDAQRAHLLNQFES